MNKRLKGLLFVLLILVCCGIMALVDGLWHPGYVTKSALKILVFALIPLIFIRGEARKLFKASRKGIRNALFVALPVFCIIVGGYFLLRNVFDFSGIVGSLAGDEGVTADNFLFVAIYISFVNAFLEEFFFRGVSYLHLGGILGEKFAFIFSSAAFSLYHIAIMTGWFSPLLFLLLIAGLFIAGAFFNSLDRKCGILPSYLVHMSANFAINTVGFVLFGII